MNIDITEMLEEYVRILEKSGIPRESTESKLMIEAVEEIKKLRSSLDFQIKLADDRNKSRLRLLDVIDKCRNLYEETCENITRIYSTPTICNMCIKGCDRCPDSYISECNCFKANVKKFNNIIYGKNERGETK